MQRIVSEEQRGLSAQFGPPRRGRALKPAGFVMPLAGATSPCPRTIPVQRTSERDQGGSEWSETALIRAARATSLASATSPGPR